MRIKIKYFILLFAVAFLMLPTQKLSAETLLTYGDFQYKIYESSTKGKYVSVEGYIGQEETVTIPETIDNIPVTTLLGLENYQYPKKIKRMVIPKNVDALDYLAFEKLSNLEAIEVADGNAKYYSREGVLFSKYKKNITLEFYPCAKEGEAYTIPSNVDFFQMAFMNNQNLKTLTIKAKVSNIFEFAGGSSIEKIILPNTVKNIDEYAFRNCAKLKSINLGDNVRTIGREAFDGCTSLKKIILPDSVYKVNKYAFDGCKAKIKKASHLKKQKNGSYIAKGKIGKKEYDASNITKIAPAKKKYTVKKGKKVKLNTTAYVNNKKKGTLSTTSLLSFKSSNKKVLTVSKYGNMKGIKKGKATVTVKLKTGDISYKVKVTVK